MKAGNKFNIGDHVGVISDTLTGTIVRIGPQLITIVCEDGFEYNYGAHELVINKDWDKLMHHSHPQDYSAKSSAAKPNFRVKKGNVIKEVDLHIHQLIDSEIGMNNFDKLSLQLKVARKELESAISKKHPKIIFIHGRGAGVLKNELISLFSKYSVDYHDASYIEYGQGATEVIIYQNKK